MANRSRNEFETQGFLGFLTAPFRQLRKNLARANTEGAILLDDSPWRLSKILSFPFRLVSAWVLFLVSAWSSSRHWWPFVWGLPALLVVLGAVAAATLPPWLLRLEKKRDVLYQGRYDSYLLNPGQAKHSLSCALRTSDRNPAELLFKYRVGIAYQADGDLAGAKRTMQSLAPIDKPGYARAHLWLADYYLARAYRPEGDGEAAKSIARQHLDLAMAEGEGALTIELAVASLRLAQLYFSEKRFAEAIPLLQRLVDNRLEFGSQLEAFPMLLECLAQQGDPQLVAVVLQRTLNVMLPLARQAPDSFELWRSIILCCLRADRFDMATEFMDEALVLSRDMRVKFRLTVMKSELYLHRAEKFQNFDAATDFRARLEAISQSLLANPINRNAYTMLLPYVQVYLLDEDRERILREAMLAADTRPIIQALVGYAEAIRGNTDEAERMWRIAYQSFPNVPFVVANLMFISVEQSAFDVDRVDRAVQIAKSVYPDNVSFSIVQAELEMWRGRFDTAREIIQPLLQSNTEILQLQLTYLRLLEHEGNEEQIAAQREVVEQLRQRLLQQL